MDKILEQSNVRLRMMKKEDFQFLWRLYTPGIFEHMLVRVETFEQLSAWLETGLDKTNVLSFAVEDMATSQVIGTTRIYAID